MHRISPPPVVHEPTIFVFWLHSCPAVDMAHSIHYGILLFSAAVLAALLAAGEADSIGFSLHHRSSPVVRRWADARGHAPDTWWPEAAAEGTSEYYSALSRNDRALFARRGLASGNDQGQGQLAFGNATFQLEGYLHYAEVAVGTPKATFLVALDTGSDLFWVPCDCQHCGNATAQGGHAYSPSRSSTSKTVTCKHALCLCDRPEACALRNSSCPYTVRYVPANASSSGVLVEDVLYLSRENQHGAGAREAVQAPIVFGCGREQTAGAFLGGLMGLGMGKVSVPSLLASGGNVASNSFSMCFSDDGAGRISFGDAVSPGQAQTPFILTDTPPTCKIHTRGMNVENLDVPLEFDAVVDSGASFTYLTKDPYTAFAYELISKIQDQRANLSASVPFEYCYVLSPNQTEIYIPDVSFWTKGGGKFPVTRPFFVVMADDRHGNGAVVGYCLAILKSETGVNVFGRMHAMLLSSSMLLACYYYTRFHFIFLAVYLLFTNDRSNVQRTS
uniref:Uncharacterized protein n=1 Tax=Avena sativa TaxID=4498 RepID=A0ACD5VUL0_AVESA